MNSDETVFPICLKHPFFMIISGKSGSGKTTILLDILLNKHKIIDKPIKKIVYVYGSEQESFNSEEIKPLNIQFTKDIDNFEQLLEPDSILIFDDLFFTLKQKKYNEIITDFSIRRSHHQRISVILLVQTLFEEKFSALRENSQYQILTKPHHNRAKTLRYLSQLYPGQKEYYVQALNRCSSSNYCYLFISLDDYSPSIFSLRNRVYPDKLCEFYVPKDAGL